MAKGSESFRAIAVIPAYNEQDTIASVVQEVKSSAPFVDVLVVDDGSHDDTYERARNAGATVLRHPFNMGIGAAVQTGFIYAVANGYDVAIQVDGDGQHDPKFIKEMLDVIGSGNADVVSGSRFLQKRGFQSSFLRRIGIKFFQLIYRLLVGMDVTDCTSGFRAFGGDALRFVAKNYPDDYPEPEVLIMLNKAGFKFREIPVVMRSRQGGATSIRGFKSLHYMIKVTFALIMHSIRRAER